MDEVRLQIAQSTYQCNTVVPVQRRIIAVSLSAFIGTANDTNEPTAEWNSVLGLGENTMTPEQQVALPAQYFSVRHIYMFQL
jgi:hypothetical protein